MITNQKLVTRSVLRWSNLVINQKEGVNLRTREPSSDLGQEVPILVTGIKTGSSSKGKRLPKENSMDNRSIFSPGPPAKSVGNLEDETILVNPSSISSRDPASQTKLEVSADDTLNWNGGETAGILGPTANPFKKQPFPSVDWKKKKCLQSQPRRWA